MKIMVCYDGSRASKEAFRLAREHAKAFAGSINIVSSMTKGTETEQKDIEKVEQELNDIKSACTKEGFPCETHLLIRGLSHGEDLVQFALEKKVDEIIIGVKRRSKVEKIVFGSTAQFVILKAHCPVVAVK
jgi:nucleotide-binding universal stress UspA family protein